MKASKFNYYLRNAQGDLLIYNSLNYEFVKILCEQAEMVENCLKSKKVVKSKGIFKILTEKGIFVPDDCDELALAHSKFIECVNNDGVLSILIPITEDCNFRCPYCYEEHKEHKISQGTIESIIKFVQKNISKYRGLYIYWFGGEPLLEIEIIEQISQRLITICNFHRKVYLATISTNGYYLTLETLKRLIECNVVTYQITIDGSKTTHNKYRIGKCGEGTFDVIMNNLCNIRDHMDYGIFTIDIRTNYTNEIYENIDEFIEILRNNFSGDKRFCVFPRTAIDLGGDSIEKMRNELISEHKIIENEIYSKLASQGKGLNYDSLKLMLAPGQGVCYAAKKNHYGIGPEGSVFKCTDIFQSELECRIGRLVNGKIHIDKYEEIKWEKSWEYIDDECKNCFLFPVCFGGGCALQKFRELYEKKPKKKNCMYEKKSIDSILLLFDSVDIFESID